MKAEFYPLHLLLAGLAGWLNRHQQDDLTPAPATQ